MLSLKVGVKSSSFFGQYAITPQQYWFSQQHSILALKSTNISCNNYFQIKALASEVICSSVIISHHSFLQELQQIYLKSQT